jgi:hypothetical protein
MLSMGCDDHEDAEDQAVEERLAHYHVIPAKAGIQQENKFRRSRQKEKQSLVSLREAYSKSWIPAFAGMTEILFEYNSCCFFV